MFTDYLDFLAIASILVISYQYSCYLRYRKARVTHAEETHAEKENPLPCLHG